MPPAWRVTILQLAVSQLQHHCRHVTVGRWKNAIVQQTYGSYKSCTFDSGKFGQTECQMRIPVARMNDRNKTDTWKHYTSTTIYLASYIFGQLLSVLINGVSSNGGFCVVPIMHQDAMRQLR
jgi:hypothetical protein